MQFNSLVSDWANAQTFREQTTLFVRDCLTGNNEPADIEISGPNSIITSFQPIGKAIRRVYTVGRGPNSPKENTTTDTFLLTEQLDTFLFELTHYVQMCGVEQRYQIDKTLPTIEEYHHYRQGSSAVGVCMAIIEYETVPLMNLL